MDLDVFIEPCEDGGKRLKVDFSEIDKAVERLNHMQESISEAKASAEELKQLLEDIKFVTVSVNKEDCDKDNS